MYITQLNVKVKLKIHDLTGYRIQVNYIISTSHYLQKNKRRFSGYVPAKKIHLAEGVYPISELSYMVHTKGDGH